MKTRMEQTEQLKSRLKLIYEADSSRSYHNWQHIEFMLETLRQTTGPINEIVELAVLYHDVIYIPGSEYNEIMSSRLIKHHLGGAGVLNNVYSVDENTVWKAARIIEATMVGNHTSPTFAPADRNEAEVMDADLAALGVPDFVAFVKTQDRVWAEHVGTGWIGGPPNKVVNHYRHKTANFLAHFLKKPVVYHTPEFRLRFESAARENIKQYIHEFYNIEEKT